VGSTELSNNPTPAWVKVAVDSPFTIDDHDPRSPLPPSFRTTRMRRPNPARRSGYFRHRTLRPRRFLSPTLRVAGSGARLPALSAGCTGTTGMLTVARPPCSSREAEYPGTASKLTVALVMAVVRRGLQPGRARGVHLELSRRPATADLEGLTPCGDATPKFRRR